MKMKRKISFIALVVCITLCVPLSLFSQSQDFEMDGTVLIKYNGTASDVTIPASVTSIGREAFSYNSSITSIIIPEGVTSIQRSAFDKCSNLTSIFVDANNRNYSSLQGVLYNKGRTILIRCPAGKQDTYNVPASVTEIGSLAFKGCTGIINITVDTQNNMFSSVDGVLFNKNRTILIAYPIGKQGSYTIPANVTTIDCYAFYECTGLTDIIIPASVTRIEDTAFYECSLPAEVRNDIIERFGIGPFMETRQIRAREGGGAYFPF